MVVLVLKFVGVLRGSWIVSDSCSGSVGFQAMYRSSKCACGFFER